MTMLILALALSGLQVSASAPVTADKLAWLAGHWCGTSDGVFSEEVWLAPQAGSLIGMHRDSKGGALVGFEYFRIVQKGSELIYWTQPGGMPAVAFSARQVDGKRVEFVNLKHDFPKRISYQRVDANTLRARIDDGSEQGKSMQWTWTKDCQPPARH